MCFMQSRNGTRDDGRQRAEDGQSGSPAAGQVSRHSGTGRTENDKTER